MTYRTTGGVTRCTRCGAVIRTDGTWKPLAAHDNAACERPAPDWLAFARITRLAFARINQTHSKEETQP